MLSLCHCLEATAHRLVALRCSRWACARLGVMLRAPACVCDRVSECVCVRPYRGHGERRWGGRPGIGSDEASLLNGTESQRAATSLQQLPEALRLHPGEEPPRQDSESGAGEGAAGGAEEGGKKTSAISTCRAAVPVVRKSWLLGCQRPRSTRGLLLFLFLLT